MTTLEIQQNPLKPSEWTAFDSHSSPDLRARPRLSRQPGLNRGLNGGNLRLVDRYRVLTVSHYLEYSWRNKYRQALEWVEPAKQVARKQGQFEFLYAVRPPPSRLVYRQKRFVSFAAQLGGHEVLGPALGLQREPRMIIHL
jgi:hypothetical protein